LIVDVPWTVFGAIVTFVTDGEPGITNELTELYSYVSGQILGYLETRNGGLE